MRSVVRPETAADHPSVWQVNQAAFGRGDEANLVNALRDGGYARISLVVERDGRVVAHILFSAMEIVTDHGAVAALSLAPMAVVPELQRTGIGSELVRRGLQACREGGHQIVIVLGHPEFYPRFGFSAEAARPLQSPFAGEAWMAMELVPGALQSVAGKVRYPPPFGLQQ